MTAPGSVVSELYTEPDNPQSTIQAPAPPSPPAPIAPPPPVGPSITKRRMSDETPDGRIRDTSGEAVASNSLRFQDVDADPKEPASEPPQVAEPAPGPPPEAATPTPEPPKLYAGKFKTAEDLEKSYQEAERKLTQVSQEKAELERRQLAQPAAPAAPPHPPSAAEEQRKNELLAKFVQNPDGVINEYVQKAQQTTMVALATQEILNTWRKENADLVDGEKFVTAEMAHLAQADPDLARKPLDLLKQATANFRQYTGKIRTEAKKEALTTETRVVPLIQESQSHAAEQPTQQAPLDADTAFDLHLRMMKEQERKSHRGLRR